jgi:hypothetical protein
LFTRDDATITQRLSNRCHEQLALRAVISDGKVEGSAGQQPGNTVVLGVQQPGTTIPIRGTDVELPPQERSRN